MSNSKTKTQHQEQVEGIPGFRQLGQRLPWMALIALATAAFIGILTEAMPAGMLPEMSVDLGVSESWTGQMLTVFAIASSISAIPLSILTAKLPRKLLLIVATMFIALANVVTAVSVEFVLTMVVRFIAGIAAGLIWALLVEYARRLAPPHLQGRAIAVTMAGVPLALSLGIPFGTFLSGFVGWRPTFILVAALGGALLVWIVVCVPNIAGRAPVGGAAKVILGSFCRPGVCAVLFVVAAYVLAHNIVYTYIATYLAHNGMGDAVDSVLLVFGVASVVSVWVVGVHVDRRLRVLTIGGAFMFAAAMTLMAAFTNVPLAVFLAAILWGLGWGGVTTLLQTAVTDAGGDPAQALLVTIWNGFMAAGGAIGGVMLDALGPASFPWGALLLMVAVLTVTVTARKHAFPIRRPA